MNLKWGVLLRTGLLACLVLVFLAGFASVGSLQSCLAMSPRSADAVVVLGGGNGLRYARARELMLQGYSPRLLVLDPTSFEHQDARLNLAGKELGFDKHTPPWWSAWGWWHNPQSRGFVGSEVLKLVYYLVRYRFGLG